MARHSKWHNIQVRKGKQDKSRSMTFTKLVRHITVAAREGGANLEMNFSLRLAVERAKDANVPKDNIERAIKRGTGELQDEAVLEELVYEGFGPGNTVLMVDIVTDNKNRSAGDIKNVFNKHGGTMAGPGSVQWQFSHVGVVRFVASELSKISNQQDEFELALIDAGASDVTIDPDGGEVITNIENLKKVVEVLHNYSILIESSGLEWIAKEHISLDEETLEKIHNLIDALEENDDVHALFTNLV